MVEAQAMPMLQDFARWLTVTGITDDEGRRNARWVGVSTLVRSSSRDTTEALLRTALKTHHHPPAAATLQKIREAFHAADNTFEMHGNDKELRILAGSTLAACLAGNASVASQTALAVSTALVGGSRKTDLPMDLNVLAEAAIVRTAESNSKRPDLSLLASTANTAVNFETAAAKAKEGTNFENVGAAFGLAAQSTSAALGAVMTRQTELLDALQRYMRIQDEELQMLWWLVGERSLDFGCRLDDVDADARLFLFAKELAGLTQYLPGPRGVRALLSRAGIKEKKIALANAVNAADPPWLRTFMPERDPSAVTAPVHFAAKRQLETGVGAAWIAGWAASVELSATISLSALDLGMQIYRERLLMMSAGK